MLATDILHVVKLYGFRRDLHDCAGIICNAGFELTSESLYLGKKILVKPVHGQMEQTSNAAALIELGYGHVMKKVEQAAIEQWLDETKAVRITYPNTARYLVKWIKEGMQPINQAWCNQIWSDVKVIRLICQGKFVLSQKSHKIQYVR